MQMTSEAIFEKYFNLFAGWQAYSICFQPRWW